MIQTGLHSLRGNSCRTKRNRDTEYWKIPCWRNSCPKMKSLSSFTHFHVVPNLYDLLTVEHKQLVVFLKGTALNAQKKILKVIHMAHEPHFLKPYDSFKWEHILALYLFTGNHPKSVWPNHSDHCLWFAEIIWLNKLIRSQNKLCYIWGE